MPANRVDPFLDNWTYLKVELNWLERLLLLAVARQRQETKTVERVAQTKADRATSHWWKGMVSLDDNIAYDSPQDRRRPSNPEPGNYQQQIEARIRASHQHGIVLALPNLCDRFQLSPFEKNVILLGLAPEVHRRYAQLYGYLQTGKEIQELPTVDLALRLLCRNDAEWKEARSSLVESSPSVQSGLIELVAEPHTSLLNRTIKLPEQVVNYLLSDRPSLEPNFVVSANSPIPHPVSATSVTQSAANFTQLVLPKSLIDQLQHLSDRVQFAAQVDQDWNFQTLSEAPGTIALFTGVKGTGKTTAANALASTLNASLTQVDLALLTAPAQLDLIEQLTAQAPTVLLVKSAERWLGRSLSIPSEVILNFLQHRREHCVLTLFSAHQQFGLPVALRSRLQFTLMFPKPDAKLRSQLWQQAFPLETPLDSEIDWQKLGRKYSLTGGEIVAIARSAAIDAAAENSTKLSLSHILKAISRLARSGVTQSIDAATSAPSAKDSLQNSQM